MPTSAQPRGKIIDIVAKDESAFGTPPSGNYQRLHVYSLSGGGETQDFEDNPLLGQARVNDRDLNAPVEGLPTFDLSASVPLDLAELGQWLRMALGAPSSTGSDPDYTHVFNSGTEVLPYRTLEVKTKSGLFLQHVGVFAKKLSLQMSRQAGIQKVDLSFGGKKTNKLTSTAGGTPTTLTSDLLHAKIGVCKINDAVAANVMSVQADYETGATEQNYVGGAYTTGADLDNDAKLTGRIRLRWIDATYFDLAAAGTPLQMELIWAAANNRSFNLLAENVRLKKVGPAIAGPGAVEQEYDFRAEQTASRPMVVFGLANQVASYA